MDSPCGRGQPLASNQPHSTSLLDVIGLSGALTVERQVELAEGVIKEWLRAKWLEWRLKEGGSRTALDQREQARQVANECRGGALWREQRGYRDGGINQTGIWPLEQRQIHATRLQGQAVSKTKRP